jgi:hypothetical protein
MDGTAEYLHAVRLKSVQGAQFGQVSVKASLNGIAHLDAHNLFLSLAPNPKVRTS